MSQTWSHDSRGDLLRRRVVSATRTTALSNSTTDASVRNVRCDPGWHGQLLTFLQSAGGEVCCWSTAELISHDWELNSKKRARQSLRNRLSFNSPTDDGRVRRSARRPSVLAFRVQDVDDSRATPLYAHFTTNLDTYSERV